MSRYWRYGIIMQFIFNVSLSDKSHYVDYTNCLLNSRLIYVDTFGNPYAKRLQTEFHSNVDEKAAWIIKNVLKAFYWLVKHLFDVCIKISRIYCFISSTLYRSRILKNKNLQQNVKFCIFYCNIKSMATCI